ncbi:MAG: hypothetical protein ACYCSN_01220 [Acidobacteriaceae bacterium]
MTTIEVLYHYAGHPTESAMAAIGKLSDVYGIRRIQFKQAEKSVLVEYDATRLNEAAIHQLLCRASLDIGESVSTLPPQPPPPEPVPAAV